MIFTEEGAKKRVCPEFTRSGPLVNCVASGCMHWRWASDRDTKNTRPVRVGFCGLSGHPTGMDVEE